MPPPCAPPSYPAPGIQKTTQANPTTGAVVGLAGAKFDRTKLMVDHLLLNLLIFYNL
jgi:hypothetical protein